MTEHPKEMVEILKNWRAKKNASLHEKNEENKMKLQEIFEGNIRLITEKTQLPKYALGKLSYNFAKADELNSNFRIYPENLVIREIDKKSEELKKAKIAGQLDHPLEGNTRLDKAMHILSAVSYDKKTKLASAESFILDTTGGRNFMTLIDAEVPIGASMRSFGTVGQDKKINPDWALQSIDFVQKPSFGKDVAIDASNLIESVDSLEEEEKEAPSEVLIQSVLSQSFGLRQERGHKETWGEFLAENETIIRAAIVSEHSDISVEEALIHMGENDTLMKLKAERKVKVWTADEIYFEAKIAGVSPDDFAKKLNELEERKKVDLSSGFSEDEAKNLVEEAERSGKDMKDPTERKKIFEFAKTQAAESEKTIHEKALHLQARMLKEGKTEEIGFIENILREEQKEAEIEEKRMVIKGQVEREMIASGAFVSNEQMHKFVNRQLRKAGLPILTEDGE